MKKINNGYLSLFEHLVNKDFLFAAAIDKKLYPLEHANLISDQVPYDRRFNETPKDPLLDQFLGALQPLASIANDFQYTFSPYKSRWEFLKDLVQPLRGLCHILQGLANLAGAILFFLVETGKDIFTSNSLIYDSLINLLVAASWFIDGLSSLVRGFTQIVVTPLTWILRIPLRGLITRIKGTPDVSESEDIQRLVKLGDEVMDNYNILNNRHQIDNIKYRLHEEYQKALSRGQHSNIAPQRELELFNGAISEKNGVFYTDRYLGLFRRQEAPSAEPPNDELNLDFS